MNFQKNVVLDAKYAPVQTFQDAAVSRKGPGHSVVMWPRTIFPVRRIGGKERAMTSTAVTMEYGGEHLDKRDVRRLKAILIGSAGNLVEWYDFYAYAAFALYFAGAFFPNSDPVVQQLNAALLFAA